MMERVVPNKLTNSLDSAYLKDLDDVSVDIQSSTAID